MCVCVCKSEYTLNSLQNVICPVLLRNVKDAQFLCSRKWADSFCTIGLMISVSGLKMPVLCLGQLTQNVSFMFGATYHLRLVKYEKLLLSNFIYTTWTSDRIMSLYGLKSLFLIWALLYHHKFYLSYIILGHFFRRNYWP